MAFFTFESLTLLVIFLTLPPNISLACITSVCIRYPFLKIPPSFLRTGSFLSSPGEPGVSTNPSLFFKPDLRVCLGTLRTTHFRRRPICTICLLSREAKRFGFKRAQLNHFLGPFVQLNRNAFDVRRNGSIHHFGDLVPLDFSCPSLFSPFSGLLICFFFAHF